MTNSTSCPRVTIVTPVHNGAQYLKALIESVRRQSYPNIEHIIIDDGSSDDGATVGVLSEYEHLRWWSRPNKGQYATINEGFEAATGDIVTTISADDYYVGEDVIEAVVTAFTSGRHSDVVFGRTLHVAADEVPLPVQPFHGFPLWVLPYNLFISHCSLFIRTASLKEHGLTFDESYRYVGDADWVCRVFRAPLRCVRIPREIAAYRHHDVQTSRQPKRSMSAQTRDAAERVRVKEELGAFTAIQFGVDSFVSWRHRIFMARSVLLTHGVRGLARAIRDWLSRVTAR